jgi:O-antigen/teichoic acid export membrane protein
MNPGLNQSRSTVLRPGPSMEEPRSGVARPVPWSAGGNAVAALQSSAARNFAWLATDKIVATVLGLLVFGMIARHYGPVGSGHYAFALTLLQAALCLSLVCSTAAILPRLSRMSRGVPGVLANVFVVRLLGSIVAAVLVAIYAWFAIGDPDRMTVALMVVAAVPLVEPFFVATLYWQSRNDNRLPVLNRGAGLLVRTTVVAAAVAFGAPLWVPAVGWILEMTVVAVLQVRSMGGLGRWQGLASRVSVWRASRYFRYGVRFLLGIALGQLFLRGDRLVLAQLMPAHEYGIYATGMQLVDVWHQVGQIIGVSIGPAYLYAALRDDPRLHVHWRTPLGLAAIGLLGLAMAYWLGRPVIGLIFGSRFESSYPYLVAGTAFAVLAFIDVFINISIAVKRQPYTLAAKWGVSAAVAIATQLVMFPRIDAFSGPLGLTCGIVSGWLALAVLNTRRVRTTNGRPPVREDAL